MQGSTLHTQRHRAGLKMARARNSVAAFPTAGLPHCPGTTATQHVHVCVLLARPPMPPHDIHAPACTHTCMLTCISTSYFCTHVCPCAWLFHTPHCTLLCPGPVLGTFHFIHCLWLILTEGLPNNTSQVLFSLSLTLITYNLHFAKFLGLNGDKCALNSSENGKQQDTIGGHSTFSFWTYPKLLVWRN